jgi:hypothetical protein
MSKAKRVPTHDGKPWGIKFMCPGCDDTHSLPTGASRCAWGFNEDLERPTLTPSILVHPHKTLEEDGSIRETPQCHSFVTDGRIQFLSDCTHALAGQTVDLPEIE